MRIEGVWYNVSRTSQDTAYKNRVPGKQVTPLFYTRYVGSGCEYDFSRFRNGRKAFTNDILVGKEKGSWRVRRF